jgi:hypothetical protein
MRFQLGMGFGPIKLEETSSRDGEGLHESADGRLLQFVVEVNGRVTSRIAEVAQSASLRQPKI